MNDFIDIPSIFLKQTFTHNYNLMFMSTLSKNKIIIKEPYYNSSYSANYKGTLLEYGKAFGYRFSDEYFVFNEPVIINYESTYSQERENQQGNVIKDLKRLEFDINGMMKAVMNYQIDDFIQVNEEIKDDAIEIIEKTKDGKDTPYTTSVEKALTKAKKRGLDLIMYKNHCYFDNVERFKKTRMNNFRASQFYSIATLQSEDFYASINGTNWRLDTNLTNLKSDFIKNGYVTLQGEPLKDIDLSNSQPCLLGNLFDCLDNMLIKFPKLITVYHYPHLDKNEIDVQQFIKLSGEGKIYDYICQETGWNRPFAKNVFIKIMFSKAGWNSHYKKRLKELFPNVIGWMDEFKGKNKSHKELAIMLQRLESEIFIQNIYPQIRRQGYIIYTKHDSILCKESDRDAVKLEMERIMTEMGLRFTLK